jgi:TolA-binding protein
VIFLFTNGSAQSNEQIKRLEDKISSLEKRIEKLEKLLEQNSIVKQNAEGWKEKANWRKLNTGMNFNSVRELLGEPLKIQGGAMTTWYYNKKEYIAYVIFYEGLVNSWVEPD